MFSLQNDKNALATFLHSVDSMLPFQSPLVSYKQNVFLHVKACGLYSIMWSLFLSVQILIGHGILCKYIRK